MAKKYEFDLKTDVKLPSVLAGVIGKEVLEKGPFTTNIMKIVDYLKSLGHKINNVLDYADDGEDNDSKPELTEVVKDVVTKGRKAKKKLEEKVDLVEDIVEEIVEEAKEVKEDVEEIIDEVKEWKEEIDAYLKTAIAKASKDLEQLVEKIVKTNLDPIAKTLSTKADITTVKKKFDATNKTIDSLSKRIDELEKTASEKPYEEDSGPKLEEIETPTI